MSLSILRLAAARQLIDLNVKGRVAFKIALTPVETGTAPEIWGDDPPALKPWNTRGAGKIFAAGRTLLLVDPRRRDPFTGLPLHRVICTADACKLGPWSVKAARIEYRRKKTIRTNGVLVSIPLHPDLVDVLTDLPDDRPFLATVYGAARSPDGLGNKMREWCDEAGLANCTAHGLRKACARRLAEAGATAHEIMAVTGHKTLAEVQRYTESAMREGLADAAHAKLMTRPNGEQNVVNLPNRFTGISGKPLKEKGK